MSTKKAVETALGNIDGDFVKALAEPARIEILKHLIINGASDVKSLSEKMPQDRSVISRHLTMMKQAGILKAEKEGRHVIYSIDAMATLDKSEQLLGSIRRCMELGCC